MIYLDTHVVVWLYLGEPSRLSAEARQTINKHSIFISPMVTLELTYLFEIGRLKADVQEMLNFFKVSVGMKICDLSFGKVVNIAQKQIWTRDPFDRLIVGHAAVKNTGLITK
ncbi:PIN domain-containing protein, partial [Desulfobacterales bacterium HSG17]|nr:PIN domain-containing protein [Desulfobacterales bacterium HSG17]